MKRNYIPGIMMRPCSITQEDNKETMMSTKHSVDKNFYESYSTHKAAMQIVAECAKIYILNNWEKVKDWSDLRVVMEDANTLEGGLNEANGGNPLEDYVEYFNYKHKEKLKRLGKRSKAPDALDKILEEVDLEDQKNHNPIKTISDVVLDTSDGDFSLTINGRQHMWISDSTVIIIADYIEKQLEKKNA